MFLEFLALLRFVARYSAVWNEIFLEETFVAEEFFLGLTFLLNSQNEYT